MNPQELFIYFIWCIITFLLAIPLHELGHLVCGLLTGYTFLSYRVGPFIWQKENGTIQFRYSKGIVAGQCLMVPPADEADFHYVLYNVGGILFNFIFSAVCLILLLVNFEQHYIITMFFLAGFIMNLIMGLMNAIPFTVNDGHNWLVAAKSKRARHGFYTILKVTAEMSAGKRLREYDEEAFAIYPEDDLTNDFVFSLASYASGRLYELGRYAESIAVFDSIPLEKLPTIYAHGVRADQLYYAIIHEPNFEKTKVLYGYKGMEKFLKLPLPSNQRILLAYTYFVEGNRENASQRLAQAYNIAKQYPVKGVCAFELDALDDLAARLSLSEKDTAPAEQS